MNKDYIAPWVRVIILLISVILLFTISYIYNGSVIPSDPINSFIFQNALLLIVVGVALLEKHFTKPADSMINSLMGIITIISVYKIAEKLWWWLIFAYLLFVFILSIITITIYSYNTINKNILKIAKYTYEPSVILGKSRILFSILFIYSIMNFQDIQSYQTISLVLFWGIFIVIWPLKIPQLLSMAFGARLKKTPIGLVIRTDWPNIIRISLFTKIDVNNSSIKIYQQTGGKQYYLLPLYEEPQGDQLVSVGLILKLVSNRISGLQDCYVYDIDQNESITEEEISSALGGGNKTKLLGYVIENSSINDIEFEIWDPSICREGMLVSCQVFDKRVYYQLTNGFTREESINVNRHGFHLGKAIQLGIFDEARGFIKCNWLPNMNTPVFAVEDSFGSDVKILKEDDFIYGTIPGTELHIGGPFTKYLDSHTAILGVTGSGKTELAFDLIKHTIENKYKVICIDLTSRYIPRLKQMKPRNLSLSADTIKDLNEKLFSVETGTYGATTEKKALKEFSEKIKGDVEKILKDFITSRKKEYRLGVLSLEEISNTKATLYITEMYLTCLLHYAKDNFKNGKKILVVIEEAHTVMPEASTMGVGDYESKGLIGKISQIALQGRKYGIGLLVIAQRTATVSKSILTQCNTIISFKCFDDTSIKFLENIYGATYSAVIPNLADLQAIIFGKGLRSQRPMMIQIPYSADKAKQSE